MKSAVEQGFFHKFAFDNKTLKTSVEFRICWKLSKFEHCGIWIQTSSHLYLKLRKKLQICFIGISSRCTCFNVWT